MLRIPADPVVPRDHVALQEALASAESTSVAFDLILVVLGSILVVLAARAALRGRARPEVSAAPRADENENENENENEDGAVEAVLRRPDRRPRRSPSPGTPGPPDDSAAREPGPSRARRQD